MTTDRLLPVSTDRRLPVVTDKTGRSRSVGSRRRRSVETERSQSVGTGRRSSVETEGIRSVELDRQEHGARHYVRMRIPSYYMKNRSVRTARSRSPDMPLHTAHAHIHTTWFLGGRADKWETKRWLVVVCWCSVSWRLSGPPSRHGEDSFNWQTFTASRPTSWICLSSMKVSSVTVHLSTRYS